MFRPPLQRSSEGSQPRAARIPVDPKRTLSLLHLNVTHWGDAVESLIEQGAHDIFCFCEHHMGQEECARVRRRLGRSGWASVFHPACPSERQSRSTTSGSRADEPQAPQPLLQEGPAAEAEAAEVPDCTGPHAVSDSSGSDEAAPTPDRKKRRGSSAGVAIVWKASLKVEMLDLGVVGGQRRRGW